MSDRKKPESETEPVNVLSAQVVEIQAPPARMAAMYALLDAGLKHEGAKQFPPAIIRLAMFMATGIETQLIRRYPNQNFLNNPSPSTEDREWFLRTLSLPDQIPMTLGLSTVAVPFLAVIMSLAIDRADGEESVRDNASVVRVFLSVVESIPELEAQRLDTVNVIDQMEALALACLAKKSASTKL